MLHFFTILWLLLLPAILPAQEILKVKHYGVDQGLPQSSVWDILQDDYGFLWVSTADGLCRFDGYTFNTYRNNPEDSLSIGGNTSHMMALDKQGDLWLTTDQGFDTYSSSTGIFSSLFQYSALKNSVYNKTIGEDKEGFIWVWIMGEGLLKFDGKTNQLAGKFSMEGDEAWRNYNPSYEALLDSRGQIWITQRNKTLISFNTGTEKFRFVNTGMDMMGMCQVSDSILLIGSMSGLIRYNTTTEEIENLPFHKVENPASRRNYPVTKIIRVNADEFWVATYLGIFVYHDQQRIFSKHYTSFSGGKDNFLVAHTLFVDKSGNIWIGTNGDGLKKHSPKATPWKHYKSPSDRGDIVKSIYADGRDMIFVGYFNNGLDVFSTAQGFIRKIRKEQEPWLFPSDYPYSIAGIHASQVFISFSSGPNEFGIYDFKNQTFQNLTAGVFKKVSAQNLAGNLYPVAIPFGKDSLLFNCRGALFIGNFNNNPTEFILLKEFENEIINSVFVDSKKTIWVCTVNGYFIKQNGSDWMKGNPRLSKQVKTISEDTEGKMWMGTTSGLYILNKEGTIEQILRMGYPLINDFVYGILRANNGDMWFSHNKGLTRYDHKKKTFRNFSVDDGLQGNEFNTGAYFKSSSGELFFGGINGTNSFFPEDIQDNLQIPSVQITRIEVNDKPFHSGFRSVRTQTEKFQSGGTQTEAVVNWAQKKMTLSYQENTLAFEFAGLEFTEPTKNQYAWRMTGIDKDWVYLGNQRFTRYANMPPGEYTFEVKASNNDGVWNETPTALSITIVPPFWQTWWFWLLELAVGIGAVAFLVYLILRQRYGAKLQAMEVQHQIQLDRERISRELHDNIGTQLSQLSSSLDWAKNNTISDSEKQTVINSGLQTTKEVISDLRESIWALKKTEIPFTEFADKLKTSLNGFALVGNSIPIHFDEKLNGSPLGPEEALDLLRICQEAAHNALRHSGCSHINFSIIAEGNQYQIKIEDNGNGYVSAMENNGHYGIENMKERVKQIGAQLTIQSDKGKGTTVVVSK